MRHGTDVSDDERARDSEIDEYLSRYEAHLQWRRDLVDQTIVHVYRADPHQWGPGKTHHIGSGGYKTLCGKTFLKTPGTYIKGRPSEEVDCKSCLYSLNSDARQEARRAEYQREQAEWRARYTAYMHSPEWQEKRRAVFLRSRRLCEICGHQRAVQVHHLTYIRLGDEALEDLLGVCMPCHREQHPWRMAA